MFVMIFFVGLFFSHLKIIVMWLYVILNKQRVVLFVFLVLFYSRMFISICLTVDVL